MSDGAFSCCVCGTVHPQQSERYRDHVCHACEGRARCGHELPVHGFNASPLGGFLASHDDRGADVCDQVTSDGRVWIDGAEYRMQAARFGGTVVVRPPTD